MVDVDRFVKAKEKMKTEYEGQGLGQKKRFKISKYAELNETVFFFYYAYVDQNLALSEIIG